MWIIKGSQLCTLLYTYFTICSNQLIPPNLSYLYDAAIKYITLSSQIILGPNPGLYSEPHQASKIERFAKIITNHQLVVNYFNKTLRLRCSTGFWIRPWNHFVVLSRKQLKLKTLFPHWLLNGLSVGKKWTVSWNFFLEVNKLTQKIYFLFFGDVFLGVFLMKLLFPAICVASCFRQKLSNYQSQPVVQNTSRDLNHFWPTFPFSTSWKHHKTRSFSVFRRKKMGTLAINEFTIGKTDRTVENRKIFKGEARSQIRLVPPAFEWIPPSESKQDWNDPCM